VRAIFKGWHHQCKHVSILVVFAGCVKLLVADSFFANAPEFVMTIRNGHYRHSGTIQSADHDFIVLTISILFAVTLLYTVFITLYLRNKINKSLDNCLAVTDSSLFQIGAGFLGDIRKLAIVSAMFLRPQMFLKLGAIDLEQVNTFPKKFKYMMLAQVALVTLTTLITLVFFVWAHLPDF
jgi:hypothetical protein